MAGTKVKLALGVAVAMVLGFQWYEIKSLRRQLTSLQAQFADQNARQVDAVQPHPLEVDPRPAHAELLNTEVVQSRGRLASQESSEAPPPPPNPKSSQSPAPSNPGRQLGLAVAQGDPRGLENLRAMAKDGFQSFNTNRTGLTDTERGELARWTFAPLQAAFEALTEEALKGNQNALQAISRAIVIPELQGAAVKSAGVLAGNGDSTALEILTHPENYGLLLSTAVGALKPAADNDNQAAIDLLASVAANDRHKALWIMAAHGLGKAAESGNEVALDALITLSKAENGDVRRAVMSPLQTATAHQNAKAADALRQMNLR